MVVANKAVDGPFFEAANVQGAWREHLKETAHINIGFVVNNPSI